MHVVSTLALLGAAAFAQVPATAPPPSIFAGLDEAVSQISKLTGLRPLKKVQYDTITKAQFKQYLEEMIKLEVKPEEIRAQEMALKKLGLVPTTFDLMSSTVDLL